MDKFQLSPKQISDICNGTLLNKSDAQINKIVIDSRLDCKDALFVALKGENFDAHDFIPDVLQKNPAAILVSKEIETTTVPQIIVDDTLKALTILATFNVESFNGKIVAVTGSSGKTTTRTMIASILSVEGKTHTPEKNFNNHIGVPLTALKLDNSFDYAVFELGCSDFNEIGPLTRIVKPHVALITNVGPAHLENLKNLEGVAKAKGEIFENMPMDSVAIINIDDPHIKTIDIKNKKTVTFSMKSNADVRLIERIPTTDGQTLKISIKGETLTINLQLPGIYNALDAVGASACAYALNIASKSIITGLESVIPPEGRLKIINKDNFTLIDDTYNANPSSMGAALDVLKELDKPESSIAVLGDMLELGSESEKAHFELGKKAGMLNLKAIIVKGSFKDEVIKGASFAGMNKDSLFLAQNSDEILNFLSKILKNGDSLLIKGSRGMKMDEIVTRILKTF
ncbi:MAG: UDP-N-acetylmuramoyl-tripeptide--D-alanyl-D-alanine ligase [Deltaproteobacteria bacterium]|nr:UDP-N-acetylmuramoyl-tripeptide--D-alanyl-D-alanine ligase [Deltaproteobacteria bacterium]